MDALNTLNAERTLTELDHVRLTHLLQRQAGLPVPMLRQVGELLDLAQVVPSREVAPQVVTMYSQVMLRDLQTDAPSKLTLCYPTDADPATGLVSVLSPVGRALLGLRVGEVARWRTPAGQEQAARIEALPFQPEASGDFTR
ncbi:MAG: GreA/GreB family elongation factor [Rubrivivax sp.]